MRERKSAKAAALIACTLSGAFVAGCSTNIDGRPVAEPGAYQQQSAITPAPPPPTPPPLPPPPPAAEILPPDSSGYVFIETKSGQTRCQISRDDVGCEAPFTNPPMQDGMPANGVSVTAGGAMRWVVGNLGAIPAVTLDYRTYRAQGWTIAATESGTRFTNDDTGHGMFVSIEGVQSF